MNINNIHDKFFKSILSDINIAKKFMSSLLSVEITQHLNIETLRYSETDFLLPDLKEVFSDMVFNVQKKDNKEVYISIILEHKSQPDNFTAVQLLLYISYGYYKQYKNTKSLNLILPVVFYHGKRKWVYKPIEELIEDLPPELKQYIPLFKTVFIDLKAFSDDQLHSIGDTFLTAILLLEKYAFNPDQLAKRIKLIYEKLNSVSNRNLLLPAIVYSMRIVKIEYILEIIEDLPTPIKSDIMTAYDTLIQKGLEKGLEKGLKKGLEKGVVNLFKKQFDIVQISDIMEISLDTVKSILKKHKLI